MRFIVIVSCVIFVFNSCGNNPEKKNNIQSDNMTMAEAARVYGFKCAICHGKDGRSVINTAPNLTESTMSQAERIAIIKYGKNTMPPQKDVLDSKTIEGIATYIESFRE